MSVWLVRGIYGLPVRGFMAYHDIFQSSREVNHPDSESDQDLDPDKPVCATSCQRDVRNSAFLCFCVFL